ncbi:MAG: NAD-dependent epimerase/dehydratase family protein [Chitinophagaceae bacterium]
MRIRINQFYLIWIILCFSPSVLLQAQKILLTGAAGFIGSHVAQHLLARGDSVVAIDNFNDAYDKRIKEYNILRVESSTDVQGNFSLYRVDICDKDAIQEICAAEQPDVICHLAARAGVRTSIDDPFEYFRTNNNGTLTILEAARYCGISHVVCASSSSVYGVRENGPFYETDLVDKQSSPYGMTKRAGELLSYVYHHLFGISITNLRFFTVYGPRGRTDMAPFIFMDAIHNNRPITVYGDGSAIRDFTYVADIVQGIIKAIDTPLGYEIVNIGRGEPILLSTFIAAIENVVQKKANIIYQPSFSGDVPQTHASIEKAQKLLNYMPQTSINQGLQEMYAWYKNEYLSIMNFRRMPISEVYIFED